MQYPSIGDYIEALRSPEDNLSELTHLSLVYDEHSYPVMSSGNFAVVFKMYDESENKYYALKCFLREQEDRADRYKAICEELSKSESPYLVDISYIEDEIFVDVNGAEAGEFPVLLMDWVDGLPLDKYIEQNIDNKYKLEKLAYDFSLLAQWLIAQPFAHGDLKPDNISVLKNGNLVLLDYDGMYTPSMKGSKALESGSPHYRHPDRLSQAFDERIDDYSLSLIHLSLRAIVLEPSLYKQLHSTEYLLISEQEQANIYESRAINSLQALMYDKGFMRAYTLYLSAYVGSLGVGSANLFAVDKPKLELRIISTEVTDEDWLGAYKDEYGVSFNADGTKLLEAPKNLVEYIVPNNVVSISDSAFIGCENLKSIELPDSLTSIGNSAFCVCRNLKSIELLDSLTSIGSYAFYGCRSLSSMVLPHSLTSIGNSAFSGCENLRSIELPDSLTSIGDYAFNFCKNLRSIELPDILTSIGNSAFSECKNLSSIKLPNKLPTIGEGTFDKCYHILGEVGKYYDEYKDWVGSYKDEYGVYFSEDATTLFVATSNLEEYTIPDGVLSISDSAFSSCTDLRSIEFSDSLTSIGNSAFSSCYNLSSIEFSDSLTSIGDYAFNFCENLISIKLPDSLTSIGNYAFSDCYNLSSIELPDSLTSIGNYAFSGCKKLSRIDLPDSLTSIGKLAFIGCENLTDIRVARGKRAYFEKILDFYLHRYIREVDI